VLTGRQASAAICRVIPLKPQGTRPPLICLGASPLFLPLARLLGPDQPFCGFDLSDLPKIELPNPCRLEDLAAHVVAGIREYQPKGPYYIGGWCLFGVLAYETARQLTSQGERVELLVLFDTRNTAYPKVLSAWERLRMRVQKGLFHLKMLAVRTPRGSVSYFVDHVKILRGKINQRRTPAGTRGGRINEKMMDINPIVVRAACEYDTPPYSGRVLMVQGTDVPKGYHWQMGVQWKQTLSGKWAVYHTQGGHDDMFKSPYVEELAAQTRASLEPLDDKPQSANNGPLTGAQQVWSSPAAPVAARSSAIP
jgi:thioesterase domain-containing protein